MVFILELYKIKYKYKGIIDFVKVKDLFNYEFFVVRLYKKLKKNNSFLKYFLMGYK